jgi:hypothetical protein
LFAVNRNRVIVLNCPREKICCPIPYPLTPWLNLREKNTARFWLNNILMCWERLLTLGVQKKTLKGNKKNGKRTDFAAIFVINNRLDYLYYLSRIVCH